jgi:hypothetical protein
LGPFFNVSPSSFKSSRLGVGWGPSEGPDTDPENGTLQHVISDIRCYNASSSKNLSFFQSLVEAPFCYWGCPCVLRHMSSALEEVLCCLEVKQLRSGIGPVDKAGMLGLVGCGCCTASNKKLPWPPAPLAHMCWMSARYVYM